MNNFASQSFLEQCEEDDTSQEGEPLAKRQKVSYDSNVAITTALVQGLPVMLNDEGTMTALQTHYAELAAQQQITDGSALSGAIAIPIQVPNSAAIVFIFFIRVMTFPYFYNDFTCTGTHLL